MKIAVSCQYNNSFQSVSAITIPALSDYCERNGYELIATKIDQPKRSIVWDRYQFIHDKLHEFDWMVHFDCDVLVTNHHIRLEEFLNGYIVISRCLTEENLLRFNDGVCFFQNAPETFKALRMILETPDDDFVKCGQDAMEKLYCTGRIPSPRFERHKAINSFIYPEYQLPETTVGNWTPGDFALHLPGMTNERRIEIFQQTIPKVLR